MATGDVADMAWRIFSVLPQRWFPALQSAPVLNGLLSGIGAGWAFGFQLLGYARAQARIATATGSFLDMIADDFFGLSLHRSAMEQDEAFRTRIAANLLSEKATRAGVSGAVRGLTGGSVAIFEPGRPADTGAYGTASCPEIGGGIGYGIAGAGYGSLNLPFQFLIVVARPEPRSLTQVGGYGSLTEPGALLASGAYGIGSLEYLDVSSLQGVVSDDDIRNAILSAVPVNATAWLALD